MSAWILMKIQLRKEWINVLTRISWNKHCYRWSHFLRKQAHPCLDMNTVRLLTEWLKKWMKSQPKVRRWSSWKKLKQLNWYFKCKTFEIVEKKVFSSYWSVILRQKKTYTKQINYDFFFHNWDCCFIHNLYCHIPEKKKNMSVNLFSYAFFFSYSL